MHDILISWLLDEMFLQGKSFDHTSNGPQRIKKMKDVAITTNQIVPIVVHKLFT